MPSYYFKIPALIKTNYGVINYNRLNLTVASTLTSSTGLTASTWYDTDRIQYQLNPTLSAGQVARVLPAAFPFVTSAYNISLGLTGLKVNAKRNKIPITFYNSSTRTYTYSGSPGFNYFYPSLRTRVFYKNMPKDVTITSINSSAKTFRTSTDAWQYNISSNHFYNNDFYALDQTVEVTDDTAGTWKLFPHYRVDALEKNTLNKFYRRILQSPVISVKRDTTHDQTASFTMPFALYYKIDYYVDRFFIPTTEQQRRSNQSNLSGRLIYDKSVSFIDYKLITVPLSTTNVSLSSYKTVLLQSQTPPLVNSDIRINSNYIFSNNQASSSFIESINCSRYNNLSGSSIDHKFITQKIYPLSATNTGIKHISAGPALSAWGRFDASDDHVIVSDTLKNELHIYKINNTANAPFYADIVPHTIVKPASSARGMLQTSISGYGRNLTIDSRHKRKNTLDVVANSYVATVSGKRTNAIEVATLSVANSAYQREFQIFDFEYPHLSSNAVSANEISSMCLMLDNKSNLLYTSLVVIRPGVIYNGNKGIVEVYGCSANTPIKLYKIITIADTSLSAVSAAVITNICTGELGTFCFTVSSPSNACVEVYDIDTRSTATSAASLTALSGTKTTFAFELSADRKAPIYNYENADNSFGKAIYFDNALGYDPFFENQILNTNRLYVQSNTKTFIFEEFQNKFLPLNTVSGNFNSIRAYFNVFCSLSTVATNSQISRHTNVNLLSSFELRL